MNKIIDNIIVINLLHYLQVSIRFDSLCVSKNKTKTEHIEVTDSILLLIVYYLLPTCDIALFIWYCP